MPRTRDAVSARSANPGWRDALWVALAALVACIAGILNDFVYDDVPLIVDNVRIQALSNFGEIVSRPYWPPPFVEQLYRPLASALLAFEYAAGLGAPIAFRIVSYALYAGCAVAFFQLASELVSRRAALTASLLFAVHPVHVEAVALGVNQGELIVGFAAMLMTRWYITARREGRLGARTWIAIAVSYTLAALTKENAFVLPALLLAAEFTLFSGRPLAERARTLWRGYGLLVVAAAVPLWLRSMALGGLVGASPAAALNGLGIGERALTMLQVVPMWLRLLVWPQHLRADYAPSEIVLPPAIGVPEVAGALLIVAAFAFLVSTRRRLPVASFGMAWCIVALFPVSNLVPTGIVLAERTLFTPSIGFLLAVAALGELLARQPTFRSGTKRTVLVGAASILVGLGLGKSINRHSLWNSKHVVIGAGVSR